MVSAKIESVNALGNVVIKFNTSMLTEGLDLKNLNSTVIDIYIDFNNDWNVWEEGFNISNYNFTWHVTNYTGD